MNQQIKTSVGVTIILIIAITVAMFTWKVTKVEELIPDGITQSKQCTMEAKLCPDGSAVGRTGPNCEFEACPGGNNDQIVGNDKDEHGCIGSAGYFWCEEKQGCLRSWEEKCD